MKSILKEMVELLSHLATPRSIGWKTETDALLKGDLIARIGLPPDRFGIALPEPLHSTLGLEDYAHRIEGETRG